MGFEGDSMEGKKNKSVAVALAVFLGIFGAHKFYLGKKKAGIASIVCSLVTLTVIITFLFSPEYDEYGIKTLFYYIALSILSSLAVISILEMIAYSFLSDKMQERYFTKIYWWIVYLLIFGLFVIVYPFVIVIRIPILILIFFFCAMLIDKRTAPKKNKYLAGVLSILVGVTGIHAAYLGRKKTGAAYLTLTHFTVILLVIVILGGYASDLILNMFRLSLVMVIGVGCACFVEGIYLLFCSKDTFDRRYNLE